MSDVNFEWLKKALTYIKNNVIDSDNNIYLTVDSLVGINNIITGWNNITLIEAKLYELTDQLNERKINHRDIYYVLLGNIHPF